MEVTLLGVITVILAIYAFFKNEKLLLYMMVFLSTFTAANLLNITITTTPVEPYEFLGALFILRQIINFIKNKPKLNKKIIIEKLKSNKLATAFIIFILIIIVGEIFLAVSGINVQYTDILDQTQTLKFCKTNITRAVITIFIFVVMIVLSFTIKTKEEVRKLLKVFCISSIFAVIWGLLQFATFYLGVPYPDFLFNNNSYAAQCFDQIANNVKRISSIALEPSTFAINLFCFLPFVLGMFLKMKDKIKSKKYILTFILLVATTACAILTTSTTTYVGLVVVYAMFGIYILFVCRKKGEMDNKKVNFFKMLSATIVSITFAAILCVGFLKVGYRLETIEPIKIEKKQEDDKEEEKEEYSSAFQNMISTIKQMTIDKLGTGSGVERMKGESIGFDLLKHSPIVGIGLGSYRTFSLFTNILLNMGIIGIIGFFYILFVVIKELWKCRKEDEGTAVMILIAILGTTVALFVGVPDLTFTYYWMMLVFGYKYSTLKD